MGFWKGLGTGLADLVTFGGYSKEKQLEEQRRLNEVQMEREDNAYQRTVKDMNQAGLNPLTMSGTNGAQPLGNGEDAGNNAFDKAINLATTISGVAKGFAEAKNLNASTVGMGIDNAMKGMDYKYLKGIGKSGIEESNEQALKLAKEQKGFFARFGSDLYDSAGDKIDELIKTGTETVNQAIEKLANGKDSLSDTVKDAVDSAMDKGADKLVEKTGVAGKMTQKYAETKKQIIMSSQYTKLQYLQSEIDRYSKSTTTDSLKKINELRKQKDEVEKELKKTYGEHWRNYLKN